MTRRTGGAGARTARSGRRKALAGDYLDGQCLIAMPGMRDERFRGTVIYLCAHSEEGAMGIVVNRPARDIRLGELLVQLGIVDDEAGIVVPERAGSLPILRGGPVETGRGFVLHSADYVSATATLPVTGEISLTHSIEVLRAIADGEGPERAVLALGYAGWGAGQLEGEIRANGWLHCAADEDLIFGEDTEGKYTRALGKLGVDVGALSTTAGRA